MRKYLYAEDKKPMIVESCQEMEGWHDSPLGFIKTTDFGVDPEDEVKVQCLGESIEGVKDYCNGMLNLSEMKMKDLREFAKTHCKKRVRAKSKPSLIAKIRGQDDNSSRYH